LLMQGVFMSRMVFVIACCLAAVCLNGCVVYEPVPAYPAGPSNFDRAWQAAMGGAQDAGVQITSAEPSTGVIRGTKDGSDVSVVVARQANGSVRVQFDSNSKDAGLADRFSRAYERRMGR
jgi:hypothetical protein